MTRQRNRVVGGWQSVRDRVMGTFSDTRGSASDAASSVADHVGPDAMRRQAQGSPLAAGLVAFGVGVVAAAVFPPTAAEEQLATKVMDKAEPLKERVMEAGREVAGDLKEQAVEAGKDLKASTGDAAGQVADRAKDAADDVRQQQSSTGPVV